MYLVEIYECNNGNIFAFVLNSEGKPMNCVHIPDGMTYSELVNAAKEGFPDADPYDPDDFCGKDLTSLQEEFDITDGCYHIAELSGYCKPILFPKVMGCAGKKLFQVVE